MARVEGFVFYLSEPGIINSYFYSLKQRARDDTRRLQACSRGLPVSPNQAACAQQYPAEIAGHNHYHVLKFFILDNLKDGFSGGSGGFAVVVGFLDFVVRSNLVGVAVVVSVPVLFLDLLDKAGGFFFGLGGRGVADKARFLDDNGFFPVALDGAVGS